MDSEKDNPCNSSPCEGETAGETEKDSSCNELPGDSIAKPKQAEATRSSTRPKVLTEKMKDFRLQLMERDFTTTRRGYDTLENEEERVEQNRRFNDLNHGNQEAFRSLNDKIIAFRAPRDE